MNRHKWNKDVCQECGLQRKFKSIKSIVPGKDGHTFTYRSTAFYFRAGEELQRERPECFPIGKLNLEADLTPDTNPYKVRGYEIC